MPRPRHLSAEAFDRPVISDAAEATRAAALSALLEKGVPSRRVEDWKWTDLRPLADSVLPFAAPAPASSTVTDAPFAGIDAAARMDLINGHATGDASAGDFVRPFATYIRAGGDLEGMDGSGAPLDDLNTAFATDGAVVDLPAGTVTDRPIVVSSGTTGEPAWSVTRSTIRLASNARTAMYLSQHAASGFVASDAISIVLADGAHLDLVVVVEADETAWHLGKIAARLARDAQLRVTLVRLGDGHSRVEPRVLLDGPGATCSLTGLTAMAGRALGDNTVAVRHGAPHTESRQLFKSVLGGEATGVFQGKVIVDEGAVGTDGQQRSQAILLSTGASQNAKPELEIYCDDVACSHGSTIGQLDAASLFYLRSRGVPEAKARAMLIRAFLAEAVDPLAETPAGPVIEAMIGRWLDRIGPTAAIVTPAPTRSQYEETNA